MSIVLGVMSQLTLNIEFFWILLLNQANFDVYGARKRATVNATATLLENVWPKDKKWNNREIEDLIQPYMFNKGDRIQFTKSQTIVSLILIRIMYLTLQLLD